MSRPFPRRGPTPPPAAAGVSALLLAGLLALLAALGAAGCGKKGDPMPPILLVPAPTTELEVVQRGGQLLVELPYPQTTAAGTPLGGLTAVTVSRLVTPLPATATAPVEVDARQFEAGAETVRVLEGAELASAVRGDRIVFTLPLPEAAEPSALTLGVTTRGPRGRVSASSNRITFPVVEPPPPPTGVEVTGEAGGVRVRWNPPPTATATGAPEETEEEIEDASEPEESAEAEEGAAEGEEEPGLAGFNVYRRRSTERSYGPPIRTVGPRASTLVDESALFGERYIYAVTTVASRRPVVVESGFAEEVEVDYRDRFAPPAPRGLVALPEEQQVRLVWAASAAPDLAGYRIYRRGPDTQEFQPVTEQPVAATDYTDRGLSAGATYTYRVTAVDRAGNESEPSGPVTAAIR